MPFGQSRYIVPFVLLVGVVILMQMGAYWYFSCSSICGWYDKVQHFLAGIACGIFGVWCYYRSRTYQSHDHAIYNRIVYLGVLAAALAIGTSWEIFEYYVPEVNAGPLQFWDTLFDLFFDVLGGIFAGWCYQWRNRKYNYQIDWLQKKMVLKKNKTERAL